MTSNLYTHKCSECGVPLTQAQVATGMCYSCGADIGTAIPISRCWLCVIFIFLIYSFQFITRISLY